MKPILSGCSTSTGNEIGKCEICGLRHSYNEKDCSAELSEKANKLSIEYYGKNYALLSEKKQEFIDRLIEAGVKQ